MSSLFGPSAITASRYGAAAVIGFVTVGGLLLWSGRPVEMDGWFHLAIARDLAAGLAYDARIAEGALSAYSADREPIFHLVLAALLRLGLRPQDASVLVPALGAAATAAVLLFHTRSLVLASCGVLASSAFLFRSLMCRPHVLAIPLVLLGLVFLLRRKLLLAAAVNFFYTLAYSVPVLLLVAAALCAVARKRPQVFLLVAAGSVLGFLVHPEFPDNLRLLWFQGVWVMGNTWAGNPLEVPVPDELQPWNVGELAIDTWFPLALFAVGVIWRRVPIWMLVLQGLLLVMALRSVRFLEYLAPVIVLTAGDDLRALLPAAPVGLRRVAVVLLLVAVCLPTLIVTAGGVRELSREREDDYTRAAEWLAEHAGDDYVFNADWSSYPILRYFGGRIRLAQGLDPTFVPA